MLRAKRTQSFEHLNVTTMSTNTQHPKSIRKSKSEENLVLSKVLNKKNIMHTVAVNTPSLVYDIVKQDAFHDPSTLPNILVDQVSNTVMHTVISQLLK